jgi:hypothetical protein
MYGDHLSVHAVRTAVEPRGEVTSYLRGTIEIPPLLSSVNWQADGTQMLYAASTFTTRK